MPPSSATGCGRCASHDPVRTCAYALVRRRDRVAQLRDTRRRRVARLRRCGRSRLRSACRAPAISAGIWQWTRGSSPLALPRPWVLSPRALAVRRGVCGLQRGPLALQRRSFPGPVARRIDHAARARARSRGRSLGAAPSRHRPLEPVLQLCLHGRAARRAPGLAGLAVPASARRLQAASQHRPRHLADRDPDLRDPSGRTASARSRRDRRRGQPVRPNRSAVGGSSARWW